MRRIAVLLAGALCGALPAAAQQYPAKPVRFVVPFAPGGATDLVARTIAEKITPRLGQTVVVDNRPGAGALIGAEIVAHARPDGYTILLASSATHAINPHLHAKIGYDALKDFEPVILVARGPLLVVVAASQQVQSIKDLIALAKAKPGQVTFGSGGTGSPQHLSVEIFKRLVGVEMTHVPYKGSGPAIVDLLAGQITTMFDNTAVQHVKAGKLRAIATTGLKRMSVVPDVPTVRESGIAYDFYVWQGVAAPAKTPAAIVQRLNEEMVRALQLPDVQQRLTLDGAEIVAGTPAQFGEWIRSENARMGKAIRESGAKAE